MKGVVLPGVVGEQDVVDVVVGLARQLELGESVVEGVAVRAPHREFNGVLAGVRSVKSLKAGKYTLTHFPAFKG